MSEFFNANIPMWMMAILDEWNDATWEDISSDQLMFLELSMIQSDLVLEVRVPKVDACTGSVILCISSPGRRIYVGELLGHVCERVAGFPPLSRR